MYYTKDYSNSQFDINLDPSIANDCLSSCGIWADSDEDLLCLTSMDSGGQRSEYFLSIPSSSNDSSYNQDAFIGRMKWAH